MSDMLPEAVRRELAAARLGARRAQATRTVHVGDAAFPILEMSGDGFSVEAASAPRLHGLIDIYDGPRHVYRALIVASEQAGDMMRYEFKRNTAATGQAPVDFERADDPGVTLLPPA
jgi:hypothetical protein